ncbi:hypothetical protein TNCV_64101 [Trichonephila clavipes]|nr:hypothetical protein TNCV_64101 [Trichonephila clavipes]
MGTKGMVEKKKNCSQAFGRAVLRNLFIAADRSTLWERFQDVINVDRYYSKSHYQVTMPNESRYLAVTTKRSRRSSACDMSRQVPAAASTIVSQQTVCV